MSYAFKDLAAAGLLDRLNRTACFPGVCRSESDVQITSVHWQLHRQLAAVIIGTRWQYIRGHQKNTMKSQSHISCKYRSPSRSATESEKGPPTTRIIDLCLCNPIQEPIWNGILPRLSAMVYKLGRINYFSAMEVADGGVLAHRAR